MRYLFCIYLYFLFHFHVVAQALGKPGATWVYLHHSFWDGPVPKKHTYKGQIKIDSLIYDKIVHTNTYNYYFNERNKQLYFIQPNEKERLLVDKNSGVGDFWFIEPPANSNFYPFLVEVLDTGFMIFNNIQLKKWDLKYTHWDPNNERVFYDSFVERIGSINRYIDPYDEFLEDGADAGIGGELICYSDDEIFYERKPGTCSPLLANSDLSIDIPYIHWDDRTHEFSIQNINDVRQICIYDYVGKLVLSNRVNSSSSKFVSPISAGVLIFVYQNGFTHSVKF